MERTLKKILDELNEVRDPQEKGLSERDGDLDFVRRIHTTANLQNELERAIRDILVYPSRQVIPVRI